MFFHDRQKCKEITALFGIELDDDARSIRLYGHNAKIVLNIETSPRRASYALAKLFVSWIDPFDYCLLWVTQFGIWPSSENLHLYYKIRHSYHNFQSIADIPGHGFQGYEVTDLITFIDVVLQFGWDTLIINNRPSKAHIAISHDGCVTVFSDVISISRIEDDAKKWGIVYTLSQQ